MAQPLHNYEEPSSGIDAAVSRLEQAFLRLEETVANTRGKHHSLRTDNEKLNHLLHDADEEIGKLKEAVHLVTDRLDRTIGMLEKET